MLILAFDTATSVATAALVDGDEAVAERTTQPRRLLEDVDALLRQGGVQAAALEGVVVGTGPGSFTSLRMGLSAARALALALDIAAAGVSTLDALAAGASGARPVIDARRREVFTVVGGKPVAVAPAEVELERGEVCVGDGAVRYRDVLEAAGAEVPPDESELHVPQASIHVRLAAGDFGPADQIEPVYVRVPDAERSLA
jgi:tRNA threonylcarbamoyladenosine biosynthesis protein TsaB